MLSKLPFDDSGCGGNIVSQEFGVPIDTMGVSAGSKTTKTKCKN